MLTVQLTLPPARVRHLVLLLLGLDLVFIGGMVAFIHYWGRFDQYGPDGQRLIRYVLMQFHLGAENVVAAWYSSMLLLAVAVASCLAFALERRTWAAPRDRWLGLGWLAFAAVFTLLSWDEIGSLHERVGMMVALNKASLLPSARGPVGWVYMLTIPIVIVAAFMLTFAWVRLRQARAAFALIAAGVALYLSDPLLEALEWALVRSGSSRIVVERILEEGVAELGGTLCFLVGVLLYASRLDAGPWQFRIRAPIARTAVAVAGVLLTVGVPIAHFLENHLPAGDSGVPQNWFPSAAFALFALILILTDERGGAGWLAAACLVLSAYFGAGLFEYARWFDRIHRNGVLTDMLAAGAAAAGGFYVTVQRSAAASHADTSA